MTEIGSLGYLIVGDYKYWGLDANMFSFENSLLIGITFTIEKTSDKLRIIDTLPLCDKVYYIHNINPPILEFSLKESRERHPHPTGTSLYDITEILEDVTMIDSEGNKTHFQNQNGKFLIL